MSQHCHRVWKVPLTALQLFIMPPTANVPTEDAVVRDNIPDVQVDRNSKDRDQPWKRLVGDQQAPTGVETENFEVPDPDQFYSQSL